jgi:YbbR domain-containing protein
MDQLSSFLREAGAVMASVLRTIARSLRENSGLAVVSLALALALWVFVTEAENPVRVQVVAADIPVQPVNVGPDVVVESDLDPVRVRVRVEESVFESLNAADFQATVDLDGLTVGSYELPVEVLALTTRGGVRIEDVLPERVRVDLTHLVTKRVPVLVNVQGDPASGFAMGRPQTDVAAATVFGPGDNVALVSQAVAIIDVSGRTEPVDQAVRLQPKDDRGNLVEKVTVEPSITGVQIPIRQVTFSKPVAVVPQITGVPGPGYNITGVSVEPPTVTIRGPQSFIEEIVSISTRPLSVNGETSDIVNTVSLDIPPGDLTIVGNPSVTVTVRIQPGVGEVRFGIPVSALNLGGGIRIIGSLPTVDVSVTGPLPELLKLTNRDVTATVDLAGKDAGSHRVAIKVTVPETVPASTFTVSPQDIQVTLEKN